VKTFTLTKEHTDSETTKTGQSEILFITTLPAQSSPPIDLIATSTSSNEIMINWKSPKRPNGVVIYFEVIGTPEVDSYDYLDMNRNCEGLEKMVMEVPRSSSEKKEQKSRESSKDPNTSIFVNFTRPTECCSCKKTSFQELVNGISFEDAIHNTVYVQDRKKAENVDSRKDIEPEIDTLIRVARSLPVSTDFSEFLSSSTTPSIGESTSTTEPVPEDDGDVFPKSNSTQDIPLPPIRVIAFNVTASNTSAVVLKNLTHFTEYTIQVRACHDESENVDCSTSAITSIRTQPYGGANDIERIRVDTGNITNKAVVTWDEPKDPNGLIITYRIEYRRINTDRVCGFAYLLFD
jgi:insulin receptor